jgi:fumarate reductase subunit C
MKMRTTKKWIKKCQKTGKNNGQLICYTSPVLILLPIINVNNAILLTVIFFDYHNLFATIIFSTACMPSNLVVDCPLGNCYVGILHC